MGWGRRILGPVYYVAGWINDYPLRTAGGAIALSALLALFVLAGVEADTAEHAVGYSGLAVETADAVLEAARTRPAYVVAAAVGAATFLFYNS